MTNGTVKFFNAAKGYGFVTPDGGGPDIFLPSAAVADKSVIKQGQRVAFEQVPDTKGPKITTLEILAEAPVVAPMPASVPSAPPVTIYCRMDSDDAADVIEAVRGSGARLALVDYIAAPPSVDQLKRMSQMVSAGGQSLVRRYDPMFFALQLDDRFILDQDFWTAVFEHPELINGPVITVGARAAICKTAAEAQAFLAGPKPEAAAAPKTLSPRIAALMRGEAVPAAPKPAAPKPVAVEASPPPKKVSVAVKPAAPAKLVVAAKPAPKAAAKPVSKPVAKKPAAKPVPKKPAAKPAKAKKK